MLKVTRHGNLPSELFQRKPLNVFITEDAELVWLNGIEARFKVNLQSIEKAPAEWALAGDRSGLFFRHPDKRKVELQNAAVYRRLRSGHKQALAKACGARPDLRVLDALSGWGTDGLTLAGLGCDVLMVENHPSICALALYRIQNFPHPVDVICDDIEKVLPYVTKDFFDVIFLDPLFGPHPKTAKSSLPMQVLSTIGSSCDIEKLLYQSMQCASSRVVVKRRHSDKSDIGMKPDWTITAKTIRFEIFET